MIAFHASTVEIKEFYIPYGGLHLGGMMSAIECALRKLYAGRDEGLNIDKIYIHRCSITPGIEYDSQDMGSDVGWKRLNITLTRMAEDFDYIKYINKYEPDILPSYCFFDTSRIQILDCSTMHMDVAEDILNGTVQDVYRY